jgi:hypothetical protein
VGAHCAIIANGINIGVDLGAIEAALKFAHRRSVASVCGPFAIATGLLETFLRASMPGFRRTVS